MAGLMAVGAIVAIGWVTLSLYGALVGGGPLVVNPETTPFFGPQQVSAYFSRIVPLYDARGQTLAHVVMVLCVAVLVLVGGLSAIGSTARLRSWGRGWLGGGTILLGLAGLYFGSMHRPVFYVAGAILLFVLLGGGKRLIRGGGNGLLGGLTLLGLAAAALPGFVIRPDLSNRSWWEICFSQAHFALVVAPADLLAEGRRLLVDVVPAYGLALPVLAGSAERAFGPLSMGGYVHALQGLQAVYLALATFLFWRHARGRWVLVIPALGLVFPWYHFCQHALFFPNQSPWRTIAFPLSALVVGGLGARALRATALVLGGVSGAALLFNLESGLAVTAGSLTYLVFRHRLIRWPYPWRRIALSAALLFAGVSGAGVLLTVLARIGLGDWLDLRLLPVVGYTLELSAAGGFVGRPLTSDPWPVLIFVHAAFVLLSIAFRRESGAAPSFRAFVAATLLVWFAYYANRPHPWNLSSYYLLYGFLLIDSLRFLVLSLRGRRRVDDLVLATLGALVLIALPNLCQMAAKGARQVAEGLKPLRNDRAAGSRIVSGLYISEPGATELLQKAAFVRARLPGERPFYLTSDSYLVPKLAGAFAPLPVVDACWQTPTRAGYDRVLGALKRPDHEFIYMDAPGTLAHENTTCSEFYARIRLDIEPFFRRTGVEQGWELWQRRGGT